MLLIQYSFLLINCCLLPQDSNIPLLCLTAHHCKTDTSTGAQMDSSACSDDSIRLKLAKTLGFALSQAWCEV